MITNPDCIPDRPAKSLGLIATQVWLMAVEAGDASEDVLALCIVLADL